jgi:hypothetical protein
MKDHLKYKFKRKKKNFKKRCNVSLLWIYTLQKYNVTSHVATVAVTVATCLEIVIIIIF